LQDNLGFHKVSARWVPRHLTEEHKHNRLDICFRLRSGTIVKVITSWITSPLAMKPGFIIRSQIPNSRAYNVSTHHLWHPKNSSRSPLLESSCSQCLGLSRAYPWTLFGMRYHSNKRKVLQHAKKWTEAGYSHKMERKVPPTL
jgi:hypothetical protein